MNPLVGGALISTAGGLAGGLMGKSAADDAREANAAQAAANVQMQREFAQNGIRWKVEDAKAAGIHPLYALGANTASFNPVSLPAAPDNSMASAMSDIGQNIGRAVGATRTGAEKMAANLNLQQAQANLDGQLIDNQIKQAQLAKINAGPNFPSGNEDNFMPGQGDSGTTGRLVKVLPKERTASQPGRSAQEAGWVPDVGYSRTDTGLTPVVPNSLSESLEDDIIGKFQWRVRNQLMPNFGKGTPPANSQLPPGANKWLWSWKSQEWQPGYADGRSPPKVLRYK